MIGLFSSPINCNKLNPFMCGFIWKHHDENVQFYNQQIRGIWVCQTCYEIVNIYNNISVRFSVRIVMSNRISIVVFLDKYSCVHTIHLLQYY